MNILVTGANGQLGNEMRVVSKKSNDRYFFTDVNHILGQGTLFLDITNLSAIRKMVKENQINAIVNCAAYTNVDEAENHQELAEMLNAKAPENLAIAIKEVNGLLIHISTDYVFGGDPYNTPCRESQKGTPTGIYGLTKLHGEENIQKNGANYIIFRTAWLYSEFGKNFVKTMLNLTASKSQLKVVFDQVGTPTYAFDLAEMIEVAWENYKKESQLFYLSDQTPHDSPYTYSKNGIYHFSNEGVCSWYDFTKMIAVFAGNKNCNIQPCHSKEFPSPVRRPAYSVLDKTKVKETFDVTIPYWTNSLKTCINNLIK